MTTYPRVDHFYDELIRHDVEDLVDFAVVAAFPRGTVLLGGHVYSYRTVLLEGHVYSYLEFSFRVEEDWILNPNLLLL